MYTTSATRAVMESVPPPEAKAPERSTLAVVPSMAEPEEAGAGRDRAAQAGGLFVRRRAGEQGFIAAVAGMVVCGTRRSATPSCSPRRK